MRFLLPLILSSVAAIAAGAPESVRPENVLRVVTADWNGDGGMDRALLVQNGDDADLHIYLSESSGSGPKLAAYAKAFAWAGSMWGTLPELKLLPNTSSLQVVSQNDAVGRDRWTQTLTLAYRNGAFVVAGYTFSARDTLEPDAWSACDVNLLTGKGIVKSEKAPDGKAFASTTRAMPVVQWTQDTKPQGCPE
ncbi:MAG: hypothetical protein AB7S41_14095 [Parvibaculaceae bacterium]